MTLEREKLMLTEIREMAAMDKSEISERYKVPIDSADVYRTTKTIAVLDTVVDGLDEAIAYQAAEAAKQK